MARAMFPRQFAEAEEAPFEVSDRGSDATTEGVRVQVEPRYMPEQSDPTGELSKGAETLLDMGSDGDEAGSGDGVAPRYVFSYRVRITNGSAGVVTLLDRHWVITDAEGGREEIRGPGVVGHRPRLRPGQSFEYESFAPLATAWGTMEGSYRFQRDPESSSPGDLFNAVVGRFYLVAEGGGEGGVGGADDGDGFDDLNAL